MIRVVHPGSGSWMDPDFLPIPDPGYRGQKGTVSRIRIRNTGGYQRKEYSFPHPPLPYHQHAMNAISSDRSGVRGRTQPRMTRGNLPMISPANAAGLSETPFWVPYCCPARPHHMGSGNAHTKGRDGARSAEPKKAGGREAEELRWRIKCSVLEGECPGGAGLSLKFHLTYESNTTILQYSKHNFPKANHQPQASLLSARDAVLVFRY
jgi:hypothetical protein